MIKDDEDFQRLDDEAKIRFVTRNGASHAFVDAANDLLVRSTKLDLSNMAELVLARYPDARLLELTEDQRPGKKGVYFVSFFKGENDVQYSFDDRRVVEAIVHPFTFAKPEIVLDKIFNLKDLVSKLIN